MTHKFKDEITDWLNGEKYESRYCGSWTPINELVDFVICCEVRKVDVYRDLKQALKEGKTIQYREPAHEKWTDLKYTPSFRSPVEWYRIKPKTKKMVQWLFKSELDGNFYWAHRYFDIGIKPEVSHGTPIKPLPHTEIEVEDVN